MTNVHEELAHCDVCSMRSRCLLSKVSSEVKALMLPHVVERSVQIGEDIEAQGEHSAHLGVVKLGLFKSERTASPGNRAAVCVVGRGRLIGYANLFKQASAMTQTAMTPARVCLIPIHVVYDHAFRERQFRQSLYQAVGSHIENVADWAALIRESNISKRLMAAFDLMAREEGSRSLRIPSHVELGELVMARRESVARHITLLQREGQLVKLDRWRAILRPTPEELGMCR
ncbi:MAG: Crp/Fnr family transcriptional regulator [Hydrogenophaga sp.]|nr:Crp/Fnr family transcriptional regulator [Hydrogenophaga sp.]